MKVNLEKQQPEFNPIKIEITLESEADLQALYAQLCVNFNGMDNADGFYFNTNAAPSDMIKHDKLIEPLYEIVYDYLDNKK